MAEVFRRPCARCREFFHRSLSISLRRAKDLRDRVQQALIYPAFLAVAGAALITIFITYMVPQLTGFMAQIGGALPLPTRILMQIHHGIITYWWLAILIVIGASVGFRAFVRTE